MDADEYLRLYESRQSCPPFEGLVGRISWGDRILDEDYYHRFCFVAGSDMLHALLGMSDLEAMLRVGLPIEWIRQRLGEGTRFKLHVFPSSHQMSATWDGLFRILALHYPLGVYSRVRPYADSLKIFPYRAIDPEARLKHIAELPLQQRLAHPEFMTEERLLSLPSVVTLYQARAFFYHALDCNNLFTGTGTNAEGEKEYLVPNAMLGDIKGLRSADLSVRAEAEGCPSCGCM